MQPGDILSGFFDDLFNIGRPTVKGHQSVSYAAGKHHRDDPAPPHIVISAVVFTRADATALIDVIDRLSHALPEQAMSDEAPQERTAA